MGDSFNRYADVTRGRLSDNEIEEIDRLGGHGLSAGPIGLKLNRHPATVNFALYRLGHRKLVRRETAYMRGGVLVKPFTKAEDALILKLRVQGLIAPRIAERLIQRFGHPRSAASVKMRLTMLAGDAACREAAA